MEASENKKDQVGRRKSCLHKAPEKKKIHNVIVAMKIVFLVIK